MCRRVTRQLECHPVSVTAGRRFVSDALATWGMPAAASEVDRREDILLIATELLSNAVKAASGPIVLSLEGHRNRVDIAVADDNPAPAVRVSTGVDTSGGRGLLLVDALSEHWGQRPGPDRTKVVWAQVAVPATATLAVACTHGVDRRP